MIKADIKMGQEEGKKKLLEIVNSKPVIGAFIFIMLSLATVFAGNIIVKEGSLNASDRIYDKTGFVTPVASINAYAGSSAPSGWLLCDGANYSRTGTYAELYAVLGTMYGNNSANDFKVPDLRGIFVRGSGTNGVLNYANGSDVSAAYGTYQNDSMQGHYHNFYYDSTDIAITGTGARATTAVAHPLGPYAYPPVKEAATGTNGVPRTGAETNPANLGLNYIIKY